MNPILVTSDYKVYDSFLECILVIDRTGRYIYANGVAMDMLGLRAQKLTHANFPGEIQFSPALTWDSSFLENLSVATPYTEVQFVHGKKVGTLQISVQPLLGPENQGHYLVTLYDKSLEYVLHEKYKRQISQKEEMMQEITNHRAELLVANSKLDRKIEHISFLLEFSEATRFLLDEPTIIQYFLNYAIAKIGFSVAFYFKWNPGPEIFSVEASTTSVISSRIELPKTYNSSQLLKLQEGGLGVFSQEN